MAQGAAELMRTDLALSATGLAGPEGDGISPVGTVYLGIYFQGDTFVRRFQFPGDRAQVQKAATEKALELAMEAVK
jgi:nicotinamide mononucleotide (NMN) deamidase PncC